MLRTAGPDVYDQWVNHEIPFNDPAVATALAEVGKILKNPKYVNGGFGDVKTIATTSFQDAGLPILEGTCYMHRQATFYAANWPGGHQGRRGRRRLRLLPAVRRRQHASRSSVRGEFTAAFADRPEVKAFQTYLSIDGVGQRAGRRPCGTGGCVSGEQERSTRQPGSSPIDKLVGGDPDRTQTATFRFDGSDLMPGAVGAGTFWKGMTNWITGTDDKATLDNIEQSWPTS